jgi:hypothetical protein
MSPMLGDNGSDTYRQECCSHELEIGKSCKKAEVGGKDDKIEKENDASVGTDCAGECKEADELDNECEGKSAKKTSNHEVIHG